MASLVKIMDTISQWIDEIPPIDQPQRFGNKAYRDWFKRLEEV
jgi:serine/threonine-protein phosphatase 2A activator